MKIGRLMYDCCNSKNFSLDFCGASLQSQRELLTELTNSKNVKASF